MTSWVKFEEPSTIVIPSPDDIQWPETEYDEGYDPERPWRLQKYDPNDNGKGYDDDIGAQFEHFQVPGGFIRATATYDQLLRFTNIRQTRFEGPPNRDGSNTNIVLHESEDDGRPIVTNGSPDLRCMWKCYAAILAAIHREGQMWYADDEGWIYEPLDELQEMMDNYPAELEMIENQRLGRRLVNNRTIPGFEWLYPFGQHLMRMTASLQAIISWAKDTNIDPKDYFEQVGHLLLIQLLW